MKNVFSLFAALLMMTGILTSCDNKEAPEPPKKEPTKKMRQWDDWVDPNRNPPHVDTTLIKP